jgi:hypothetical protein
MDYLHSCSFCGWGRTSTTPVMLSPSCDRCGCALDALVTATAAGAPGQPFRLSARSLLALRAAGVLSALLGFYAAAKVGYEAGGPSGALIAFGIMGFVMLPFVPEQV